MTTLRRLPGSSAPSLTRIGPSARRVVWRRAGALLASSVTLVLLAGCVSSRLETIPGVVPNVTQDDIPVPRGFSQKTNGENWSYQTYLSGPGQFRSWVGEYVGYKQVRDLVPWYVSQMQKDGWAHNSTEEGDRRILTFVNNRAERARIIMDREYNIHEDRFQTVIRAEIGPQPTEAMDIDAILNSTIFPSARPVNDTDTELPPGGEPTTTSAGSPSDDWSPTTPVSTADGLDRPGLPETYRDTLDSGRFVPASAADLSELQESGPALDSRLDPTPVGIEAGGGSITSVPAAPVEPESPAPAPAVEPESSAPGASAALEESDRVFLGPPLPESFLRDSGDGRIGAADSD